MAITHRSFVLFTFPLCCASVALLITSLATGSWFVANSRYDGTIDRVNDINYGLFTGKLLSRLVTSGNTYEIILACLTDEGICGWSCLATAEEREAEIRELFESGTSTETCNAVSALLPSAPSISQHFQYSHELLGASPQSVDLNLLSKVPRVFEQDKRFISLAVWASTIAFVALGILMASIGAAFAVFNTASNPVEPILGILGLFIWNSVAVVADIVALSLWGAEFAITLTYNAVLPETISGQTTSNGLGALGYSYWLVIISAGLHLVCIGLLLYRRHLILTEPPAPTIRMEEDPDGAIFLY